MTPAAEFSALVQKISREERIPIDEASVIAQEREPALYARIASVKEAARVEAAHPFDKVLSMPSRPKARPAQVSKLDTSTRTPTKRSADGLPEGWSLRTEHDMENGDELWLHGPKGAIGVFKSEAAAKVWAFQHKDDPLLTKKQPYDPFGGKAA